MKPWWAWLVDAVVRITENVRDARRADVDAALRASAAGRAAHEAATRAHIDYTVPPSPGRPYPPECPCSRLACARKRR